MQIILVFIIFPHIIDIYCEMLFSKYFFINKGL